MRTVEDVQAEIDHQRRQAALQYPQLWSHLTAEWRSEAETDCTWLTYSANYLFRTGGIRWAIDPLTLYCRLPEVAPIDPCDLSELSFVLLTHRHSDHLDVDLLTSLKKLPIQWVVPQSMIANVQERVGLLDENIIMLKAMEPVTLDGIRVTSFEGQHWETRPDGSQHGVPSTSYLVECRGKRWLFPGDTRTYNTAFLPDFDEVDAVFAHVWLGRNAALIDPPPLIEAFCRFYQSCKPRRLILAHLEELGREPTEYWDLSHARKIIELWSKMAPGIPVSAVRMGEKIIL